MTANSVVRHAPRRILFLLLALMVPCGTPVVAQSVLSTTAESELVSEAGEECVSISVQRRRRGLSICRLSIPAIHGCDRSAVDQRLAPFVRILGHRLNNGLLAPLRC